MIRIAVVDDEEKEITIISQIIDDFFNEKQLEYTLKTFTSGETLLSDELNYDLIFLDIQMGDGIDGIETAQKLRVINKNAALFYVTSYSDYIRKSMTIHPFAFIVKPYSKQEIYDNLVDYLSYTKSIINREKQNTYQLNTIDDRVINISFQNILYFHYLDNRIINVITDEQAVKIKDTITHLIETLDKKQFIIPNQSFIVNLNRIKEVDGKNKKLVMANGDIILISRRKYTEVFERLNRFISKGKD